MAEGLSLRALGRELGVSDKAIRKGVASGRLRASIGRTEAGKPVVIDLAVAKAEWLARGGQRARTEARTPESAGDAAETGIVISATTLVEAQRLATLQRERKLRIENDLSEGRTVQVERVSKEAFESSLAVREGMLNIAARLSPELAGETDAGKVFLVLDKAIRDALNAAADALLVSVNA